MKTLHYFMGMATAILILSACGSADRRTADDSVEQAMNVNDTTALVYEDDADFAVRAADAGLAEIQLGRLAMERATDPRIKDFATRMVRDHEQVNDELLAIAARHEITLPPAASADKVDKERELREKTGQDFDREYIEVIVDEHDDAVSLFEDASSDARNADLQAFAAKTLPALKKHLEEARSLRDSISPSDTTAVRRPPMP